jgi:hypothetical protein
MTTITYTYATGSTVYHVDEFKGVNEATITVVTGVVTVPISISSIYRTGATATATTFAAHGYVTGRVVEVSGAVETEYNGAFPIVVTSPFTFTYTVVGTPASPATGVISALSPVVEYKVLFVKADVVGYNIPQIDLYPTVDLALAEYKLRYLTP